jgi:hypothetical protein
MIGKFALALMFAAFLAAPTFASDQWVTLAQSQPFVAPSDQTQRFTQSVDIKKGQEKLELTLTYYNGSSSAPGFKWLRVASPSMHFVTEQQFEGKNTLSADVTGELTWDDNQLLVTAGGPKGATFAWVLRTPQPTVTGVTAGTIFPGSQVTVTGTNLCPDPLADEALINGKAAHIVAATQNQLVLQVPEDLKSGSIPIVVKVAGLDTFAVAPLSINVLARPYLKSLSSSFVGPGETLTINGEGFSPDPSQDIVEMGPFRAEVVSASNNSITVVAPGPLSDSWYGMFYKVKIKVNGVRARNTLTVECHAV